MANIKLRQELVGGSKLAAADRVKFYDNSEEDIKTFDLAGLTNYMESNINAENLGLTSYSDFFRGNFADEASMPAFATLGQWLIRTDTDTIWVWDTDGGAWKQTGAGGGGVQDNAYTFVYSATDGSGYGFVNAHDMQGNPDSTLSVMSSNDAAVGVATLKNPGDYFEILVEPNITASNLFTLMMTVPGSTHADIGFKNIGTQGSGKGFHSSNPSVVIGHNTWGGTYIGVDWAYASGMDGLGQTWKYPANGSSFRMGYRMESDYRVALIVDGDVSSVTDVPVVGGVDVWAFRPQNGTINQPTGAIIGAPTNTNAAVGSASKFWMSTEGSPSGATQMALGNGYFLYSRDTAGDAGDVELTSEEATVAMQLRVFTDYAGLSAVERASTATAVYKNDTKLLEAVKDLASGYFHTLDLTVPEIQAKMAAFGPALEAAAAGSVEVTQGALALVVPSDGDEAALIAHLQGMLAGHLAKFPR